MSRSPLFLGIATFFVATSAFSHARIVSPPPRDTIDGHKFGPCGNNPNTAAGTPIPKGTAKKVYPAGTTQIPVEFEETVTHGGWFAIDLSTTGDDKNFTMIDMIKDPNDGQKYTTVGNARMVNLPGGTTCKNCTLRLRQVMCSSDGIALNDAKCVASSTTISTYFSCADIQILAAGEDAGPPPSGDAGSTTSDSGTSSSTDSGSSSGGSDSGSSSGNGNNGDEEDPGDFNSSSGCSTSASVGTNGLLLAGIAAVGVGIARRRRRR